MDESSTSAYPLNAAVNLGLALLGFTAQEHKGQVVMFSHDLFAFKLCLCINRQINTYSSERPRKKNIHSPEFLSKLCKHTL